MKKRDMHGRMRKKDKHGRMRKRDGRMMKRG